MRRLKFLMSAALVALALLAAACGSSPSGLDSKSPRAILDASAAAVKSARSVRYAGTIRDQGFNSKVDLVLTAAGDTSGTISAAGETIQMIDLRSATYLKASASFWRGSGLSAAAAARIAPHWVKTAALPSGDATESFSSLGKSLAIPNGGALTTIGPKAIHGQTAIGVHSAKYGSTIWIADTGPAYPISFDGPLQGSTGSVSFSEWNSAPEPTAPPHALPESSIVHA